MRIKVLPIDDGACGHYRLIWPAEQLQRQGHDVKIIPSGVDGRLGVIVRDGEVVRVRDPECDVLVVQRMTHRAFHDAVPFYQKLGVRIVIDIDDDYGRLPANNSAFKYLHPKNNPDDCWDWVERACQYADVVVAATPALARRYRSRQTMVVANYVPERYRQLRMPTRDERPLVGWAGTMMSHVGDLAASRGGVAQALAETDAEFRLVGAKNEIDEVAVELSTPPTFTATGWFSLQDYPTGLADLDVGIVPLADNQFNHAKSALKGLEYASVGVPFVATATSPYEELAGYGVGRVARRPREWRRELVRLITDRSYRCDLGDAYHDKAAELTIEKNAWKFAEAWLGTADQRVAV